MNPLWVILPLWSIAMVGIVSIIAYAFIKSRPTFVTPRHGIRVYIRDERIAYTPAEVDRVFDLIVEHAIAFYMQYVPDPLVKLKDAPRSMESTIRSEINGTYLYLSTTNIVPPVWRDRYPTAKDKNGASLPAGSNVNGLGYPGGVAIRLEDERDLNIEGLDYTLGSSALAHEHMGHRVHRAIYGHDLRHSKDIDSVAKPVWDAVRGCKHSIAAIGL